MPTTSPSTRASSPPAVARSRRLRRTQSEHGPGSPLVSFDLNDTGLQLVRTRSRDSLGTGERIHTPRRMIAVHPDHWVESASQGISLRPRRRPPPLERRGSHDASLDSASSASVTLTEGNTRQTDDMSPSVRVDSTLLAGDLITSDRSILSIRQAPPTHPNNGLGRALPPQRRTVSGPAALGGSGGTRRTRQSDLTMIREDERAFASAQSSDTSAREPDVQVERDAGDDDGGDGGGIRKRLRRRRSSGTATAGGGGLR